MEFKVIDRTIYLRIGREGVLRLGDTDGVMADTHLLYQFDNLAGMETVSHYTCSVEVAGYLFDFAFHAIVLLVSEGQRLGWFVLNSIYYQIGKVNGSLSSFGKALFTAKPTSSFSSQWRRIASTSSSVSLAKRLNATMTC